MFLILLYLIFTEKTLLLRNSHKLDSTNMIKKEIDGWKPNNYPYSLQSPISIKATPKKRYRKLLWFYSNVDLILFLPVGIDIPDYVTVRSRDRPMHREDIIKRMQERGWWTEVWESKGK